MKIRISGNKEFETCPEYAGPAVCVDVTPPETREGRYGKQTFIKLVFEVRTKRSDGSPFCVWSQRFTPSLNPKANLRGFLGNWFGGAAESILTDEFETEDLVGMKAYLIVMHAEFKGETYANIKAIRPLKPEDGTIEPSGTFVRKIDRQAGNSSNYDSNPEDSGNRNTITRGDIPEFNDDGPEVDDDLVIHVGKYKGKTVGAIPFSAVEALWSVWRPSLTKTTRQDQALLNALEARVQAESNKQADNECPF